MNYNYDYQNKTKKSKIIYIIIIVLIAIIISAFVFKTSSNTIVNKISNVIIAPFGYITNMFSNLGNSINNFFVSKEELISENEKLKDEINNLKLDKIQNMIVLEENESLKEMLNIDKKYNHYELKHGNIIMKNLDNYTNEFTIDIGKNNGIKLYQSVIHKDGLVGYISSVTDNTSIVTTLLDPKTSVSVTISAINETAILKGDINYKAKNELKLEYLPVNGEISLGDIVYTSGLSSMYFSSIPVAKIVAIENKKNESDRYAICQPIVNINSIRQVAVIIK